MPEETESAADPCRPSPEDERQRDEAAGTRRGGSLLARGGARLLRVRWIVRAPIWAYRHRLGWLFGTRLLLLEHTGRISGRARHVVLEVVEHPRPTVYIVASGFGTRAQWYRNIQADPQVRIQIGAGRPVPALARTLTTAESSDAVASYRTLHPGAWKRLKPVFEATLGSRIDDDRPALPLVSLTLHQP